MCLLSDGINAGMHIWGSAGCACGDVGNAGVVLLGSLRFADLYQAAAAFSLQKFRNPAVFSGSMITEIRFRKTYARARPRCAHTNLLRTMRTTSVPVLPVSSLALLHNLAKTVDPVQFVPKLWTSEECNHAHLQ